MATPWAPFSEGLDVSSYGAPGMTPVLTPNPLVEQGSDAPMYDPEDPVGLFPPAPPVSGAAPTAHTLSLPLSTSLPISLPISLPGSAGFDVPGLFSPLPQQVAASVPQPVSQPPAPAKHYAPHPSMPHFVQQPPALHHAPPPPMPIPMQHTGVQVHPGGPAPMQLAAVPSAPMPHMPAPAVPMPHAAAVAGPAHPRPSAHHVPAVHAPRAPAAHPFTEAAASGSGTSTATEGASHSPPCDLAGHMEAQFGEAGSSSEQGCGERAAWGIELAHLNAHSLAQERWALTERPRASDPVEHRKQVNRKSAWVSRDRRREYVKQLERIVVSGEANTLRLKREVDAVDEEQARLNEQLEYLQRSLQMFQQHGQYNQPVSSM